MRLLSVIVVCCALALVAAAQDEPQSRSVPECLPDTTRIVLWCDDVPAFFERARDTALGELVADPETREALDAAAPALGAFVDSWVTGGGPGSVRRAFVAWLDDPEPERGFLSDFSGLEVAAGVEPNDPAADVEEWFPPRARHVRAGALHLTSDDEDVLDLLESGAFERSLAAAPDLLAAAERVFGPGAGAVRGTFGAGAWIGALIGESEPLRTVWRELDLDAARALVFEITPHGRQFRTIALLRHEPAGGEGLFAVSPAPPFDRALLELVPKGFATCQFFALDVRRVVSAIRAQKGVDPAAVPWLDLFERLGPRCCVMHSGEGSPLLPDITLAARIAEPGTEDDVLELARAAVTGVASGPFGALSAESVEVAGTRVFEIDSSREMPIAAGFFARDGWFVAGTSVGALRLVARRLNGEMASIEQDATFEQATAWADLEGATGLLYADLPRILRPFLDQALVADVDRISEALAPVVGVSRAVEDGIAFEWRGPPFGEAFGAGTASAAAFAFIGRIVLAGLGESWDRSDRGAANVTVDEPHEPRAALDLEMWKVSGACERYRADHDRLPATATELAPPLGDYLDEAAVLDPWGRPYVVLRRGARDFAIVCLGADGEPGGEGEDADVTLPP